MKQLLIIIYSEGEKGAVEECLIVDNEGLFKFMNDNYKNDPHTGHVIMTKLFTVYKIAECVMDFS